MANDQQFCLRWNNHQTTLVEIFDKLLSNERLVDCTLAAEGQYLRAHKVLLSACSPYFELILSQHNDKHPIIILKDVTFRELKALMDYMYRGEVNVSQDQLGALLKVAENLQIKGLSDSGGGGTEPKEKPPEKRPLPPPPPAQQPTPIIPRPGLTIEHRRSNQLDLSTHSPSALDGSPVPRKRKRTRRRSSDDESSLGHTPIESHHDSSSRESSSLSIPPNVASTPLSKSVAVIPEPPPVLDRTDHILPEPAQPIHHDIVHKTEPNTEMLLEPKHEYPDDDMNEDSVEDLTLEDDMNDLDQSQAGPSGEGSSSQGFTPWHMATDRSTDEVFMQAQEAVGAQRDSQDLNGGAVTVTRVKSVVSPAGDLMAMQDVAPIEGVTTNQEVAPIEGITDKQDVAPIEDVTDKQDVATIEGVMAEQDVASIEGVTDKQVVTYIEGVTAKQDVAPIEGVAEKQDVTSIEGVMTEQDVDSIEGVTAKKFVASIEGVTAKQDDTPIEDVTNLRRFSCPCCGAKSSKCWVCGSSCFNEDRKPDARHSPKSSSRKSLRSRSPIQIIDRYSRSKSRSAVSSSRDKDRNPRYRRHICSDCGENLDYMSQVDIDSHRLSCTKRKKNLKTQRPKEEHHCLCCTFVADNQWMLRAHMRNKHKMEVLDQA